jgi:hypothetical protein
MIHLEVCSLLLFGQKTKLHTALAHGVGVRGPLQGPSNPLDPIRKPNKLEDINLSNNATNYSTILPIQLPTKNANLFATPNSWVPFQRFKISQHTTISTFARLPSRSTISRYNLKMRSRATSSTLVRLENFNTSAGNFGISLLIELPFWIQFNLHFETETENVNLHHGFRDGEKLGGS